MSGKKYDQGKLRHSLMPPGVINQILEVLEYGAKKYSEDNWKKVPNARNRYYDAAMRHLDAWVQGEVIDEESGLSHLAHCMCCLAFLMWLDESKEFTRVALLHAQDMFDTEKKKWNEVTLDLNGVSLTHCDICHSKLKFKPVVIGWHVGCECPCGKFHLGNTKTQAIQSFIMCGHEEEDGN